MGLRAVSFFAIAVVSILMFHLPYREVKTAATESLNQRQMLLAKQASFGIESFFKEQRNLLRHFAHSPAFLELSKVGKDVIQEEINDHREFVKAVTIYDKKGIIKYSYPNPEKVIGKDISSQAHVKKILREHKANVSDVFNAIQGFQAVALSEPMFEDGEFVGVVAFLIDFKHIAKTYIESIQVGDDGYAWVISRDGTELYCPVPGHTGANISETSAQFPSALAMAEEMQKGHSGTTTYQYNKIRSKITETITKHAAYYPVNVFDNLWSIAVATPESEIYSEYQSFYKKMIFATVVLFAVLIFFGYTIIKDFNLQKLNKELEKRVAFEMDKRQQQEKVMLQQARFYSMGETLNTIAHQWRQPLNIIGLCVQDIEDTYRHNEITEKYIAETVDKTMKSLELLSRTIDNFSTFYTPNEQLTELNLYSFTKQIVSLLQEQFESLNINLKFDEDGTLQIRKSVFFDAKVYPDVLKQIILSCLQNSREAVQKRLRSGEISKGEIRLGILRADAEFSIVIIDNGGGIKEEVLDKVFDQYFTTKSVSIGMGLGLYISRNILEEYMNGTLSIKNYKDGAMVTIKFKDSKES
ncbi:MAG: hypothetical protein C0602_03385 [Denitrovibrio sp.]|nr:MAG: hypothetical protein C0602_03385 [Denitrovibrio sp.]